MASPLVCLLSYGLMCSPGEVIADIPAATPLEPAEEDPAGEEAKPGSASAMLAKVQSFYDSTKDLTAGFKQIYTHPVYNTKKVSTGTLLVKKPGMMVWDYSDAENGDFYVDGKTLQVVEHAAKQVIRKDLASSDIAGAEQFLFGGKKLIEDFRVRLAEQYNPTLHKSYGMEGHTVLELQPKKKNPHYRALALVVDDATGRVDAFAILNADKSVNHFVLSDVQANAGVGTSKVKFKKPAGYVQIEG